MNIIVFVIINALIVFTYTFNIIQQTPKETMFINTYHFEIQIDQDVNPPTFTSYIYICNATDEEIVKIDVNKNLNKNDSTYVNNMLSFTIPDSIKWTIDHDYHILFDAGVLFSNSTLNSSAKKDSTFWKFKIVVNHELSTDSILPLTPITPLKESTDDKSNHVSNTSTTISTATISTIETTDDLNNSTGKPDTALPTLTRGESPPTRSAQLGMGFGITVIGILLIGEIIYFKYFYRGASDDNYQH